jgi:hypothetical protein
VPTLFCGTKDETFVWRPCALSANLPTHKMVKVICDGHDVFTIPIFIVLGKCAACEETVKDCVCPNVIVGIWHNTFNGSSSDKSTYIRSALMELFHVNQVGIE